MSIAQSLIIVFIIQSVWFAFWMKQKKIVRGNSGADFHSVYLKIYSTRNSTQILVLLLFSMQNIFRFSIFVVRLQVIFCRSNYVCHQFHNRSEKQRFKYKFKQSRIFKYIYNNKTKKIQSNPIQFNWTSLLIVSEIAENINMTKYKKKTKSKLESITKIDRKHVVFLQPGNV